MPRSARSLAIASLLLVAAAGQAVHADTNLSSDYANGGCSGLNCNNRQIVASITGRPEGAAANRVAMPWVAQFWAENNECIRLRAVKAGTDGPALRMILIAPDGQVIRRVSGAGIPGHEIVVPNPNSAGRTGFWTVLVTTAGGVPSEVEFALHFGRYFTSNVQNCTIDPLTYFIR